MAILMTSMVSFWVSQSRESRVDGIASQVALEMAQFARAVREYANVGFIDAGNASQMGDRQLVGKTRVTVQDMINEGLLPDDFAGRNHKNFFGQDYVAVVDFTRGARTGSVVVTVSGAMDEEKLRFAMMQNDDRGVSMAYRIARILAIRYPVAGVGVGIIPERSNRIEGLYGAFTMDAGGFFTREQSPRPVLIAGFQ